jgi:hypothetical protein
MLKGEEKEEVGKKIQWLLVKCGGVEKAEFVI